MNRAKIAALVLPLLAGCGPADGAGEPVGETTEALTPPAKAHDRIGIYHWGPDFTAWPGSPDRLTWGADYVSGLGARTIRVALSARDDYGVNGGATTLVGIAQSPAYQALFSNPKFATILLTVYSQNDLGSTWSDGYTTAEQSAEKAEIEALGAYLLQTYANKKFIVLNWEGDNGMAPYAGSQTAWDGYTSWIQSRVSGVVAARKAAPGATSKLYSGLEYNAVLNPTSGQPCDASSNKCVISYVGPKVTVDYYSYSSWQSLGTDTSTSGIGARLSGDLGTAFGWVSAARPALTHANFIVGEFGAARDITGECDSATREANVITTLESWGASYGIAWQALDNPGSSGIYDGFGRTKRDLTESLAGKTFSTLYRTQVPTVPVATCGAISPGGVVDAITFTSTIHVGGIVSIFGSSFSASGNVVWFKQGSSFFPVQKGSPNWFESAGQINATLPAGLVAGSNVNVYVTGGSGHDSNGQLINVVP